MFNESIERENGFIKFSITPDYEIPYEFSESISQSEEKYRVHKVSISDVSINKYIRSRQIGLKESIIKNLINKLDNINLNFDDLTYRQVSWVEFKENIHSLWDLLDNENSKGAFILLIDSIKNLKAEKMNKYQLEGFLKIFEKLQNNSSDIDILKITEILIEHDIPALRFPKGSAELLD